MTVAFRAETFGLTNDALEQGAGPTARRTAERLNPVVRQAILEANDLLNRARGGSYVARNQLREAVTKSDLFKSSLVQVLDREMLAAYETQAPEWSAFAAETRLKDFKPKVLAELSGPTGPLTPVPEHTNYPITGTSAAERTIRVGKFGEQAGHTWEAGINDDLGELDLIPNSWAARSRLTEYHTAADVFATRTTGAPATTMFNAANKNIYTGALTHDNLQAAYLAITTQRAPDGSMYVAPAVQLVVGPALKFVAERIIQAQQIKETTGSTEVTYGNALANFKLTVLPSLPGTAWFILPVPRAGQKNAIYVGKLIGYETPDIRVQANQGNAIGGGALSPQSGSFDNDTLYMRVRHVVGAAQGDTTFTLASDGLGTTLTKTGW